MEIGIDSFAAAYLDNASGVQVSASESMRQLLERIEHADQAGLDIFGLGEHHRREFLDSAPAVILAAAAARAVVAARKAAPAQPRLGEARRCDPSPDQEPSGNPYPVRESDCARAWSDSLLRSPVSVLPPVLLPPIEFVALWQARRQQQTATA